MNESPAKAEPRCITAADLAIGPDDRPATVGESFRRGEIIGTARAQALAERMAKDEAMAGRHDRANALRALSRALVAEIERLGTVGL